MLKSLDETVLLYAGKPLFVKVHYGWGWQRTEPSRVAQPTEAPPDFVLRVVEFFEWEGVLRGGVAKVEEPDHVFNGYWVVFYTRPLGSYNFTDNPTTYSIQIGLNEPRMLDPSEDPELAKYWPLWEFTGEPQVLGFGMIAASPEDIARWEEKNTIKPGQPHDAKIL